jgi:sugar phosphate isomerase/epimerase
MQLGIFAKTFSGSDPNTVLAAVAKAGFKAAHYNMACSGLAAMPDTIDDDVADTVHEAATRHGVALVGLSATWNMIHPDKAQRESGFVGLSAIGKQSKCMGPRLVTLCTGTRDPDDQWRHHPENVSPSAWADLLASMEKAIAIAEQYDLTLGIEPELANVVSDAKAAKRLLDEMQSSRLGIVLDPANLFERPDKDTRHRLVEEAVSLLGDRIVMAHAKDRDEQGGFVAAGCGVIDFAHFIDTLKQSGFDGPMVTHGLTAEEAPITAKFLADLLASKGAA